jgi:DNA-binding transcriptional LysR family regulator
MQFDLVNLRLCAAVADERSFTQGAARLPPVSALP